MADNTELTVAEIVNSLDIIKDVTVEIHQAGRNYLIAVYDKREPKCSIQGSWLCDGFEAIRKLKDINKRFGKDNYGKVQNT